LQEIQKVAEGIKERPVYGKARLPVDRVFTKAGFGTVVTGTLWSGQIETGETLELLPSGKKVKIRTLQVHNDKVDKAYAGQRVAVNLQGVDIADIERGNWLSTPAYLTPTYRMDARLRILSSSSRVLKNWNRIRFHLGTDETMARVVLLDGDELHPGQEGYVQIVMEKPVVGHKGDPFVIRYYSPVSTIGGGTIIDANASKQKRFREETLNQLIVKEEGNLSENIIVDKSLVIQSENGAAQTIVQAAVTNADVFKVTAANVTIEGFTASGASAMDKAGIKISGSSSGNCIITNNYCSGNDRGISIEASANGNTLSGNTCTESGRYGVYLSNTTGNSVTGNTFSNNPGSSYGYGICLFDNANNNTFSGNMADSNNMGIRVKNADNNTIINNTFSPAWR
jgi:parallel beta-helix repeat protein